MNLDPLNARRYRIHDIRSQTQASHARVARLVGRGVRVLELGCASGAMTELLVQKGCRVTGVERDLAAAAFAAAHTERIVVGDLDAMDLTRELAGQTFDAVVAADVLEHVQNPERILRQAVSLLADEGRVVISLPNVAHAAVRLALLTGEFAYAECGLLDRTHLRFYTYESALELLAACGLIVTDLERVIVPVAEALIHISAERLPGGIEEWVVAQPEALTYQFVFRCEADDTSRVSETTAASAAGISSHVVDREPLVAFQAKALARMDATIQKLRLELARERAGDPAPPGMVRARLKAYTERGRTRLITVLRMTAGRIRRAPLHRTPQLGATRAAGLGAEPPAPPGGRRRPGTDRARPARQTRSN